MNFTATLIIQCAAGFVSIMFRSRTGFRFIIILEQTTIQRTEIINQSSMCIPEYLREMMVAPLHTSEQ